MIPYRGYRIAARVSPHRGWRGLVFPPGADQPLVNLLHGDSREEVLEAGRRLVDRHVADTGGAAETPAVAPRKAPAREF